MIEDLDVVMIDFDNLSERKQKMYSAYRDKFFVVLDSGSDVCELKELTDREVVEIRTEGRCPAILVIKNKKMYNTIITNKRIHVIRLVADRGKYSNGQAVPMPNYLGTGMALCGVVAKGETLNDWINKNHK